MPDSAVAGPSTTQTPSLIPPVLHEVISRSPNIPKFTGTDTGPDLESWVRSVSDHLNAQTKLTDAQKLLEAKTHLAAARSKKDEGPTHVSFLMHDPHFEDLKTWPQLISFLRQFYSPVSRENVVTSLIKILRDLDKEDNSHFLAYSSQVLTKLNGWKSLIRGSDWDNQGTMDINTVVNLLHLTLVLKHLPSQLTDHFKADWEPGDATGKISMQVQKHLGKISSEMGMSKVLNNSPVNESKQSMVAVVNQPKNSQAVIKNRICHNCQKPNHLARYCKSPPFCSYHGIVGHRNSECRAQGKNQGNNQNQGQINNQGHQQGNYQSSNYHNRGGNANQKNPSRFHNNQPFNNRNSQPSGYYNTSGRNYQPNNQSRPYHSNRPANQNNTGFMHHQPSAVDMNQYMPSQQTTSAPPYVQSQVMNSQQPNSALPNSQSNFRQRTPPTYNQS